MARNLAEMLENREPIEEIEAGRLLGDAAYTELFRDLQSNILTPHDYDRAVYFFVHFHENKKPHYLVGLLAHGRVERSAIHGLIADRTGSERMPKTLRAAVDTWRVAAGAITPEAHDALADLRISSEYDVYWRRKGERSPVRSAQGGAPPSSAPPPPKADRGYGVNVWLTARAYKQLGVAPPASPEFQGGMDREGSPLKDPKDPKYPDRENWQKVDAVIVVAFDPATETAAQDRQRQTLQALRDLIGQSADIVFEETGDVLQAKDGYRIEPFGFHDGISQPVFYAAHRAVLQSQGRYPERWNPFAPLSLALRPDEASKGRYSCGSYIVFRKLEQDVELFLEQAESLAKGKGWTTDELAARFVGRKRDGQPLVPRGPGGPNDFDFKADGDGVGCPFFAHIRKTNPRSDIGASYRPKDHRIVRRAIPYGPKLQRLSDGTPVRPLKWEDGEEKGPVGLLFACAQGDIGDQFEYVQARWANKVDHPLGKRTGVDTVIGELDPGEKNRLAIDDKDRPTAAGLDSNYLPVVIPRGGAYFFAPSITFLRGLLGDLLKE